MLTRRCNMTCAHCSVQSGPRVKVEPSDAEVIDSVRSAIDSGVRWIQVTGGEPMLRERLVFNVLRSAKKRGVATTMSSNGFWGRKPATAWKKVRALKRAGLGRLTISYDRYHAEFQGAEPALNISRAAQWFDLPVNINVTRVANDSDLAKIVAPFEERPHLKMRFYDVQTVGRARELPQAELRSETGGFCSACAVPALTDDGRMIACNGPAYFLDAASPLVVGSTVETPMEELLQKHSSDLILETIRRDGPQRLLAELETLGGVKSFGVRDSHAGICDLCIDICSNPSAVAALRGRLSTEKNRAEFAARKMVQRAGRGSGSLSVEYVNGRGAARLWTGSVRDTGADFADRASRMVGRADFDWTRNAEYLIRCGLARSLASTIESPSISRWAPAFFIEKMKSAAINEGLIELFQRDVIRVLASAVSDVGTRGILLKGAAMLAIEQFGEKGLSSPSLFPRRGAGDVDILVPPDAASKLRNRLLDTGFAGVIDDSRTGPHHLAPVAWRGVTVEIHSRIMPRAWGLPERALEDSATSLPGLPSLATLDPEGMLLHAIVHSTAHLFSYGIRAGWDASWITDRYDVSGDRLRSLVHLTAMPRAFWTPARVIDRNIVKLPSEMMRVAPQDERQRRLDRVAEARMFTALETAFELNPLSKNGFFLMLHDGTRGRLRHVVSLFGEEERESRKAAASAALARAPGHAGSAVGVQIREGIAQWRAFRRAISA